MEKSIASSDSSPSRSVLHSACTEDRDRDAGEAGEMAIGRAFSLKLISFCQRLKILIFNSNLMDILSTSLLETTQKFTSKMTLSPNRKSSQPVSGQFWRKESVKNPAQPSFEAERFRCVYVSGAC